MLQSIRDKVYGWPTAIFLLVLFFSFALFSVQDFIRSPGNLPPAKVNGVALAESDLSLWVDSLREQDPRVPLARIRKKAVVEAVSAVLFRQYADSLGVDVAEPAVIRAIQESAAFQVGGRFSSQRLQQFLHNQGWGLSDLSTWVRDELRLNLWQNALFSTDFVLPYELQDAVALLDQKRVFVVSHLPERTPIVAQDTLAREPDTTVLQAQYAERRQEWMQPARLRMVFFLLDRHRMPVTVSEAEIANYYATHREDKESSGVASPSSRDAIRRLLTQHKQEQVFVAHKTAMSELAYADAYDNDLSQVMQQWRDRVSGGDKQDTAQLPVLHTTEWVPEHGHVPANIEWMVQNPSLWSALFESARQDPAQRRIEEWFSPDGERALWWKVTAYEPPSERPFDEVRERLISDWRRQQKKMDMERFCQTALQTLLHKVRAPDNEPTASSGNPSSRFHTNFNQAFLDWAQSQKLSTKTWSASRGQSVPGLNRELLQAAFEVPHSQPYACIPPYIVQVKAVEKTPISRVIPMQKKQYEQALQVYSSRNTMDLLLFGLRANARIVYAPAFDPREAS